MPYNFDQLINRTNTHSTKWQKFGAEVLPFWVADMDFAAPEFILAGLRERLDHPILGYTDKPDQLVVAFQEWLVHHFQWSVPEEWIVWVPGVVPALNLSARCLEANDELIIPTPVYHPFLDLARNANIAESRVSMSRSGSIWEMDFDAMQQAITKDSRMLTICNPQNPTGRCYNATELAQLAEFIQRNDLLLVSDEIHCNIVLDENSQHIPIGQAHPEIADRTIHLYSATKVYNIPGLSCAAAVIPDPVLRQKFVHAKGGLLPSIGPLGFIASELAFNDRSDWVAELLTYLRSNLALVKETLGDRLTPLQATYLAWIDVADLGLKDAQSYFADYGVGLSPGAQFGEPTHVRLNFGCPRATLEQGLSRLTTAINAR